MNQSYQICKHYFINLFGLYWTYRVLDNSQLLSSGATRSVLQALMVRTAKVCVTVLMVPVATTSMEAVYASQVSMVRTAETGCVHLGSMGCTVKTSVSARTNTHSGKRLLWEDERHDIEWGEGGYSMQTFLFLCMCVGLVHGAFKHVCWS